MEVEIGRVDMVGLRKTEKCKIGYAMRSKGMVV